MKITQLIIVLLLFVSYDVIAQAQVSINSNSKKADSLYSLGKWVEAISEYEKMPHSDNSAIGFNMYNKIANAYHQVGSYTKSIEYSEKAIQKDPPAQILPFIYSRLARAHSMNGDKVKTIDNLSKAISNGYINIQELQNSKELNLVRELPAYKKIFSDLSGKIFPCTVNKQYNEFDFWVGKWNVFQTGANFKVGTNVIEKAPGGCSLIETWESITGGETGKSLTYISLETNKWEQTYIGSGGQKTVYTDGEMVEGVMTFLYSMVKKNGVSVKGKFCFKLLPNGDIQQYQEETPDQGKTWNKLFDFTYRQMK